LQRFNKGHHLKKVMALLLFRRAAMQCVKDVTPQTNDQMPFECESAQPGSELEDDDPSDGAEDNESTVPEEAGYGYGV
jgi:hypothetical protein